MPKFVTAVHFLFCFFYFGFLPLFCLRAALGLCGWYAKWHKISCTLPVAKAFITHSENPIHLFKKNNLMVKYALCFGTGLFLADEVSPVAFVRFIKSHR